MKRVVKDGWHKMRNFEVYVENGVVFYGKLFGERIFPYRWNKKSGCWSIDFAQNSLDATRAGYLRGTISFK